MNQEIKDKWLIRLRSGEYKQGAAALRNSVNNSFCCLGVLCDLYSEETGTEWEDTANGFRFIDRSGYLPKDVMYWSELPHIDPAVPAKVALDILRKNKQNSEDFHEAIELLISKFRADNAMIDLSVLNDKYVPFTVIAEIIKAAL